MKPLREHLKPIALFLVVTFLMQSCVTIYHSKSATIDEALMVSKKERSNTLKNIKVKSSTNRVYKFKSLTKEDGQIYGIAHKNWKSSKFLFNQIVQYQDEKVKILLTTDQVNEIYLKNYFLSNLIAITITPVVLAGGMVGVGLQLGLGPGI
jgi:hypothetical protein